MVTDRERLQALMARVVAYWDRELFSRIPWHPDDELEDVEVNMEAGELTIKLRRLTDSGHVPHRHVVNVENMTVKSYGLEGYAETKTSVKNYALKWGLYDVSKT